MNNDYMTEEEMKAFLKEYEESKDSRVFEEARLFKEFGIDHYNVDVTGGKSMEQLLSERKELLSRRNREEKKAKFSIV